MSEDARVEMLNRAAKFAERSPLIMMVLISGALMLGLLWALDRAAERNHEIEALRTKNDHEIRMELMSYNRELRQQIEMEN